MKTRLSIWLNRPTISFLREESAKADVSIRELVEKLVEQVKEKPPETTPAILKWKGYWTKVLTTEDLEADDRAGAELRKTKTYRSMAHRHRAPR